MNAPPKAANPFAPRQYGELHAVTDKVYIYRNITNSSFVIGSRSVAVIDTQVNAPSAELLLRAVRSVTDKPIGYVVNTHYHWDHTNGNALFKAQGATVVSSKLTKEFMVVRSDRQKEFLSGRGFLLGRDPFLPEITFEGEHRIDLGGVALRLFFAGAAESDDATAIHVLGENVLMSGDTVMTGSFPIFGQPVWDEGLQDDAWIRTIGVLMAEKPARVIPGHGPLASDGDIEKLITIQRYFLDEVGRLVQKGLTAEETLRDLESRLPKWMLDMPVVWGNPRYAILRVYRGLTRRASDAQPGWQQLKPSAIPRASAAPKIQGREPLAEFLRMAAEAAEGGDAGLRLAVLKKATEAHPDSAEAFTAYADALIEESRREPSVLEKGDFFSEACRAWDQVLERDAGNAAALLGKGRYFTMMAYRGGEDPELGMSLLRKALALKLDAGRQAEAEFYLGIGYRRLADEPRARAQFAKALELNPAFMPARLALNA